MRTIILKITVLVLLAAVLSLSACTVEPKDEASFFDTDISNLPPIPNVAGLYVNGGFKGYMPFNEMLNWITANSKSSDFYAMVINANQTIIAPVTFTYGSKSNIIIMLKSDGQARTFNLNQNGTMFTIGAGVSFMLEDKIIVRGRSENNGSIIQVRENGSLIMNGGEITGNTTSSSAAVRVNGTFIMNGGSINNNANTNDALMDTEKGIGCGGGVFIKNGNTFVMNGGEIVRNNATIYGGGVFLYDGSFVMNGGKIADNRAAMGGGVFISSMDSSRNIEVKGGEITGNIALSGGGIYASSNLTMSDGVIHGNTANGYGGGGIYMSWGNLSITGGVISGNRATQEGGGIYFNLSNMNNNKFIKSASGGIIFGSNATTTLKNTSGNNTGHAVYEMYSVYIDSGYSNLIRQRNTTVESNMSLDSSKSGGWE